MANRSASRRQRRRSGGVAPGAGGRRLRLTVPLTALVQRPSADGAGTTGVGVGDRIHRREAHYPPEAYLRLHGPRASVNTRSSVLRLGALRLRPGGWRVRDVPIGRRGACAGGPLRDEDQAQLAAPGPEPERTVLDGALLAIHEHRHRSGQPISCPRGDQRDPFARAEPVDDLRQCAHAVHLVGLHDDDRPRFAERRPDHFGA